MNYVHLILVCVKELWPASLLQGVEVKATSSRVIFHQLPAGSWQDGTLCKSSACVQVLLPPLCSDLAKYLCAFSYKSFLRNVHLFHMYDLLLKHEGVTGADGELENGTQGT